MYCHELKEKVGPEMAMAMPKVKEEHEVTSELPEIVAPAGDVSTEVAKEEVSDTLMALQVGEPNLYIS